MSESKENLKSEVEVLDMKKDMDKVEKINVKISDVAKQAIENQQPPLVTDEKAKAAITKKLEETKADLIKSIQRIEEISLERKNLEARLNFLAGTYESLSKLIGAKSLAEEGILKEAK
jgi:soluble cytochrome b562